MKASKSAYVLIHTFEGCRLHAYKCPSGVWTIGWGHTAGVYEGMTITREQANELLKKDVAIFEDHLNYALGLDDAGRMPNGLPISQHQFDALLSFTFNVGTGNLARSTLLRKVKANPKDPSHPRRVLPLGLWRRQAPSRPCPQAQDGSRSLLLVKSSYLCTRRSDARLLLLTPGAVLQQCSAAPFKFCPPTLHYHNEKVSPLNFRGQFGDKLENLFYYIVDL